jgi:hypothetical protein
MINNIFGDIIIYGIVGALALVFFLALRHFYLISIQKKYLESIEWKLYELKLPIENIKTPKAMEQVFASLYGMFSYGFSFKDKWIDGKVELWASCELVGFSSSMHFFIRIPKQFTSLLESSIYSQYPNAELAEAEDYVYRFGKEVPNEEFDLFGMDLVLLKDSIYPLKTYPQFEAIDEDKRIDPIATIAEIMAGLKKDEMLWLQLLIRPTDAKWKEKANDEINTLTGRKKPVKKKTGMDSATEFATNLVKAPVQQPEWSGSGGDQSQEPPKVLTPGEQDKLKGLEMKASQIGFEAALRFMYLDKKDAFTEQNILAVMGAIRQFNGLNEFFPNKGTMTSSSAVGLFFRKSKVAGRKRNFFETYCNRAVPLDPPHHPGGLDLKMAVFSVEELATLFHPPIASVSARTLQYVGSKKGGPPSDVPFVE